MIFVTLCQKLWSNLKIFRTEIQTAITIPSKYNHLRNVNTVRLESRNTTTQQGEIYNICNRCTMSAGKAYPSGHLTPSLCRTCIWCNRWAHFPNRVLIIPTFYFKYLSGVFLVVLSGIYIWAVPWENLRLGQNFRYIYMHLLYFYLFDTYIPLKNMQITSLGTSHATAYLLILFDIVSTQLFYRTDMSPYFSIFHMSENGFTSLINIVYQIHQTISMNNTNNAYHIKNNIYLTSFPIYGRIHFHGAMFPSLSKKGQW